MFFQLVSFEPTTVTKSSTSKKKQRLIVYFRPIPISHFHHYLAINSKGKLMTRGKTKSSPSLPMEALIMNENLAFESEFPCSPSPFFLSYFSND